MSFSERMNDTDMDSGAQEIRSRMTAKRNGAGPVTVKTAPRNIGLEFGEDFMDTNSGYTMHEYIAGRRKLAEKEEEKLNQMGNAEYSRQRGKTVKMLFDTNGDIDVDTMRAMQRYRNEATAFTTGAYLDGNIETDLAFMENDPNGDSMMWQHQLKSSNSCDARIQPVPKTKKVPSNDSCTTSNGNNSRHSNRSKEYILTPNKTMQIPQTEKLSKIRINIEYADDVRNKKANIELKKGGKIMNIPIDNEVKVITMQSLLYMFETDGTLYAKLTGPEVAEAALIFV